MLQTLAGLIGAGPAGAAAAGIAAKVVTTKTLDGATKIESNPLSSTKCDNQAKPAELYKFEDDKFVRIADTGAWQQINPLTPSGAADTTKSTASKP